MKIQILIRLKQDRWVLHFFNPQNKQKTEQWPFGEIHTPRDYKPYYDSFQEALKMASKICEEKNYAYCVSLDTSEACEAMDNLIKNIFSQDWQSK